MVGAVSMVLEWPEAEAEAALGAEASAGEAAGEGTATADAASRTAKAATFMVNEWCRSAIETGALWCGMAGHPETQACISTSISERWHTQPTLGKRLNRPCEFSSPPPWP